MRGESGYPDDLVTAMVRSGDWDAGDAIMTAGQSCERCMNVLCHHYLGPDEGYPYESEEYWGARTRCKMCDHVDNAPEEPLPKQATKSEAEVEEEKVQKMLRKEPKKKPPRYDLRDNRTLDEEDEEDLGGGDGGDRDLSLKWNRVARRVAFRWAALGPSTPSAERVAARHVAEVQALQQEQPKGTPEFDEWVKDQQFKHPETGNDVGFSSLPPDEQHKIREKWKGQQQPEDEGKKDKGKGDDEEKKERTEEDVQVDLSSTRDEMRDIEAQMDDIKDEIKDLEEKLKGFKQYENLQGQAKQQMREAVRETQRTLGRKKDELEDTKEEFDEAKAKVKELKAERKDPGFAKAKREEQLRKQRAQKVERAVHRVQKDMQTLLGKGSSLPPELGGQIVDALNGLDEAQVEGFSVDFQDALQELMKQDPGSAEALMAATRAAKFGDLHGLTDPKELADRLAQLSYAQNVVANPMNIGGTPVGVTEMDDVKYSERAQAAFTQFQRLPSSLRRGAADKVIKTLERLDPETHRAQELNAILTGMDIAQIAATGESLPNRPQPTKGIASLIKQMAEAGNVEPLFKTTEDYFAEQARRKMEENLDDLSAEEVAQLATGGDEEHGYAGIVQMIENDGTPDVMRALMKDFLVQDILNDQWGDRAVRDTMQGAGIPDADDPEVRAEILGEAKQRAKPRLEQVLEAQERMAEAEKDGKEPDPEDVVKVQGYYDPEKGTGLREQSKSILDTIKEKFDRFVVSPATAVLQHFINTGEREVLEQETLPHPDEKAKEPRTPEEREEARAEGAAEEKQRTPEQAQRARKRLDTYREKFEEAKAEMSPEKRERVEAQIGRMEKRVEQSGIAPEDREKSETEEGKSPDDKEHGPGDVWETEQGNWRAKNKGGAPKTFKSREKAEQYAEGDEEPRAEDSTKGGEAPGEEFSGEFNLPIEDSGPRRFAAERVAQAWLEKDRSVRMGGDWLAHVRSFHPDDPDRPIVVLEAA